MRERTLLKIIEQQQRTISDQNDRLMYLAGHTWALPEQPAVEEFEPEPVLVSALEGLPPGYHDDDEE